MNWTSTQIPLWPIDCESFLKAGRAFELKNVTCFEHHQFVEAFAAKHKLTATIRGTTVLFEAKQAVEAPAKPIQREVHASKEVFSGHHEVAETRELQPAAS